MYQTKRENVGSRRMWFEYIPVIKYPIQMVFKKKTLWNKFSESFTGCPKSSLLCFISLYFSTIGLGKHIIETKFVFQSIFTIFLLVHLLTRIFDLCTSLQRCACASIFSSNTFFCFLQPKLLEPLPCFFVNITKDESP